jgi:TPR repeat protein
MYCESLAQALVTEPDADLLWDAVSLLRSDAVSGLEQLEHLAKSGSALSMYFIGETYLAGQGVPQDLERGMKWLRQAADAGSIEASYQIARTHWSLDEMDKAINELNELSSRGFSPAMYNLAQIYHSEDYGFNSLQKSQKFYRMAALHGHIIAKKDLAILMITGTFGNINRLRGFFIWIALLAPALALMIRYPESDRLRRR